MALIALIISKDWGVSLFWLWVKSSNIYAPCYEFSFVEILMNFISLDFLNFTTQEINLIFYRSQNK